MFPSSGLLEKRIIQVVGENLDWFLKRVLHEHYGRRRQLIRDNDQDFELIPAIDYVIKTCVDESAHYPPDSVAQWHEYFLKLGSGYSHVFQQLFIIYLQLDVANYLTVRERESKTGRQTRAKDKTELLILDETLNSLKNLLRINDFSQPVIKLSTGLWAMDNDQLGLMIDCLSDPLVQLSNYFESPKEVVRLIVGTLRQCGNPRMALFMSRVHRHENWDEDYDHAYSYLLLSSGQLIEALKYERIFMESENYHEILQRFFELCSKLDVIKSLNQLNLSVEEEEALNQHMPIHDSANSSRAVTPSASQNHIKRVTISESTTPRSKSSSHTPRNRSVQQLKKMPSFSDSPARNTRSARKKKVHY
jgi:hypothetical protein